LEAYKNHDGLKSLVLKYYENKKTIAAICAAPCFLGYLGLLKNKIAVCYPSLEEQLVNSGAIFGENYVENAPPFITGKGAGVTIQFALEIVKVIKGEEVARQVKEAFIVFD